MTIPCRTRTSHVNVSGQGRRVGALQPLERMQLMYGQVETEDGAIESERLLCPFAARSEDEVERHEGEARPYRCQKCPYSATRKCHLVRHEMTHVCKRLYKCRFCDYSTMHRSNRVVHERSHTGEKPYKCSFCNYRAAQRGNLTVHQKKHLGEALGRLYEELDHAL